MKWNIEWTDLKNIEYMIADCWRMSERQMQQYCRELIQQQELVFASEIGKNFLKYICGRMDSGVGIDWSKMQKDIRLMQELIKDGQKQDEKYWNRQYQKLTADASSCFYTEFGNAFIEQIAVKLKLNLSEDQKRLYHDIQEIEKICMTCSWENKTEARDALSYLSQKEAYIFSSWLGNGFVQIVLERFGKKKKGVENESDHKLNYVQEKNEEKGIVKPRMNTRCRSSKKKSRKAVTARVFVFCIAVSFFCGYLLSEVQERYIDFDLHNLSVMIKKITDNKADKEILKTGRSVKKQNSIPAQRNSSNENNQNADQNENNQNADQNDDQVGRYRSDGQAALDQDTVSTGLGNGDAVTEMPDILPQYQSFYQKYPNLFGWINIPGTEIDYPVMQSDDEEMGERYYYLHRDYTGRETEQGSLFVESKSSCYPQDDNTVIYGHNMSNGHYFGMLERYKDQDFLKNHQMIQFDTIYERGMYQIAAVLVTRVLYQEEQGFRYYQFYHYNTDSEFQECMDFIKETQLYDTGVNIQYGDQLLMLSTCEYSKENGRLVIAAKKIRE